MFCKLNLMDLDGWRRELRFVGRIEGVPYTGKSFQRCENLHSILRDSDHCRFDFLQAFDWTKKSG